MRLIGNHPMAICQFHKRNRNHQSLKSSSKFHPNLTGNNELMLKLKIKYMVCYLWFPILSSCTWVGELCDLDNSLDHFFVKLEDYSTDCSAASPDKRVRRQNVHITGLLWGNPPFTSGFRNQETVMQKVSYYFNKSHTEINSWGTLKPFFWWHILLMHMH